MPEIEPLEPNDTPTECVGCRHFDSNTDLCDLQECASECARYEDDDAEDEEDSE